MIHYNKEMWNLYIKAGIFNFKQALKSRQVLHFELYGERFDMLINKTVLDWNAS